LVLRYITIRPALKTNAGLLIWGAPFCREFLPAYGDYQLGDNEYRRFLKVKIAKNATSGTIASDERVSLQEIIQAAFSGEAYITD